MALSIGRLCIGAVCLGGLKRCADHGPIRGAANGCFRPAAREPAGARGPWRARRAIDVLEALKDQVARRLDAGLSVPPEVPMAAKVFGSDSLNAAAGQLMQFLGGRGYMENNLAAQLLRDARLYSVGEGPNEALTTQLGRKTRLTDAIDRYLRASAADCRPADMLAMASGEALERCLNSPGAFADRASALLWTDALVGQLACDALLLAAVCEAQNICPSDRRLRAIDWAELRLAQSLRRAREGDHEERLMLTSCAAAATVALYSDSIGDVEQALPAEEEALDGFLKKTPGSDPYALLAGLPGRAVVTDDSSAQAARLDLVPSPGQSPRDGLA